MNRIPLGLGNVGISAIFGRFRAAKVGDIVEDVVAEWAARHGESFHLILNGPAGGAFRHGDGARQLELDAVEFCRTVSGRTAGEGLLSFLVLF